MRWCKRKVQICNVRENLSSRAVDGGDINGAVAENLGACVTKSRNESIELNTFAMQLRCLVLDMKYVDDSSCLWEEQQKEDIDTELPSRHN